MKKVSHSKILTWKRCHKLYDYKYNQKLRKRIKNVNLYIGSIVHDALEAHFRGKKLSPIFRKYDTQYKKLFEEERVEIEGCVDFSKQLVLRYIDQYKHDGFEVEAVERPILILLTEDIYLEGYIDLVVVDRHRKRFIMEHKTCKSIPEEQTRMADVQTVIYSWALEQEGIKTDGVVWDYVRKKLPVVPEVLKKGGLSKNKNIDTTYEVYLDAIEKNKLDPNDYKDILAGLVNKDITFLRRIKLPFNNHLIDQVVNDAISAAKQIDRLGLIVTDRNLTRDCSWCDYNNLCQAELRGLDTEFMRKKEFTISEGRPKNAKT